MRGNMGDSSGRMRPNSGASIEIVPGAAQYQARSSGQISLQSLSISPDDADPSHVENAAFSGFSASVIQADGTRAVVAESGSRSFDNGPKLMPIGAETNAVQQSPREATMAP